MTFTIMVLVWASCTRPVVALSTAAAPTPTPPRRARTLSSHRRLPPPKNQTTPPKSMYLRVKRKRLTVFLQVEPTDTVLEVKQKLQQLVEQVCVACGVVVCLE